MTIPYTTILQDFPILSSSMRNKPFIYLDSAATSLTPVQVVQTMSRYYLEYGVNVHRGIYEFSERATREYEDVRKKAQKFLGLDAASAGDSPRGHILFTKSTTEASNLIAYSYGREKLKVGDEILTTETEHHSTLVPWHPVCQKTGAILKTVPITPEGTFTIDDFTSRLTDRTKIAVFSAMSNVTGFMPPIHEMVRAARDAGVITIVDGAQYVSHHSVNVQELDSDFLYFSAHKMLGPTGLGILYGRTELLESMEPFLYGGNMILRVSDFASTYHPLPEKFEAGTPPIAEVLGFGAALDYLESLGMEQVRNQEKNLLSYALDRAAECPWMKVLGPKNPEIQGAIMSFNIDGVHSHDLGTLLDSQGIAVRTGVHCAQPLMEHLKVGGAVRASMYFYNRTEDLDRLFEGIERARAVFG